MDLPKLDEHDYALAMKVASEKGREIVLAGTSVATSGSGRSVHPIMIAQNPEEMESSRTGLFNGLYVVGGASLGISGVIAKDNLYLVSDEIKIHSELPNDISMFNRMIFEGGRRNNLYEGTWHYGAAETELSDLLPGLTHLRENILPYREGIFELVPQEGFDVRTNTLR